MTGQGQNRKQPISTWASRKRRKLTFAAGEAQRHYSAAAACCGGSRLAMSSIRYGFHSLA